MHPIYKRFLPRKVSAIYSTYLAARYTYVQRAAQIGSIEGIGRKVEACLLHLQCTNLYYSIAEKFGEEFNLVVWRINRPIAGLKSANHATLPALLSTKSNFRLYTNAHGLG